MQQYVTGHSRFTVYCEPAFVMTCKVRSVADNLEPVFSAILFLPERN